MISFNIGNGDSFLLDLRFHGCRGSGGYYFHSVYSHLFDTINLVFYLQLCQDIAPAAPPICKAPQNMDNC